MDIPTVRAAMERGILNKDFEGIEIRGESPESFEIKDFKLPSTYAAGGKKKSGFFVQNMMKMMRAYALRPVVVAERCSACGQCVRACPVQSVQMHRGKAKVDHSKCIRCYTCHEMCASQAIVLKRSLAGNVVAKFVERKG
jgi:ferredoxin